MVVLDLVGMLVFSISGGLTAVRMRLDIVGALVLATATGLGGGILRDVLIGDIPPPALADWRYVTTPLVGGLLTFYFHPAIDRLRRPILVFDALGLGLFSVAGALKALDYGLGPVPAMIMGLTTAVGGGALRDILSNDVPGIFRPGELLAIPALAGAAVAVGLTHLDVPTLLVIVVSSVLTFGWRLLALRRGWSAPEPIAAPRLRPPAPHR